MKLFTRKKDKTVANWCQEHALFAVVFLTGACVLVVELIAMRILSPYYGNTIFTFSSVISTVLAALSLGYYVGGRIADKYPHQHIFYKIIAASGVTVLALTVCTALILPSIALHFSIQNGPLIISILFFTIPSFLLGLLSPYAIKLQEMIWKKKGIGSIAGTMFFWSTMGSIAGSIGTGFVLVPHFGVQEILISVGFVLVLLGLSGLLLTTKTTKQSIFFCIGIIVASMTLSPLGDIQLQASDVLFTSEGVYEHLSVKKMFYKNKDMHMLYMNRNPSSAVFLDNPDEHVFNYTKYYRFHELINPEPSEFLVMGAGAYTIPRALLQTTTTGNIDTVDVEPQLEEIAKQYFHYTPSDRISTNIHDGRHWLHQITKKYDVIFSDAYSSLYGVPSHMSTVEFFELSKQSLSEDGVFIGNFIGRLKQSDLSYMYSAMRTFNSVFPNSTYLAVEDKNSTDFQNIIFIGRKNDDGRSICDLAAENNDPFFTDACKRELELNEDMLQSHAIFTDNYAPTDYFMAQALKD